MGPLTEGIEENDGTRTLEERRDKVVEITERLRTYSAGTRVTGGPSKCRVIIRLV